MREAWLAAARAPALRRRGLLQVDFIGPGPVNAYPWATSIFFRGFGSPRHAAAPQVAGGLQQSIEDKADQPGAV
jgi:hypothetical protein